MIAKGKLYKNIQSKKAVTRVLTAADSEGVVTCVGAEWLETLVTVDGVNVLPLPSF